MYITGVDTSYIILQPLTKPHSIFVINLWSQIFKSIRQALWLLQTQPKASLNLLTYERNTSELIQWLWYLPKIFLEVWGQRLEMCEHKRCLFDTKSWYDKYVQRYQLDLELNIIDMFMTKDISISSTFAFRSSFYFDLQILTFLFPAGIYYCFTRLTDHNIFIILYGVTSGL